MWTKFVGTPDDEVGSNLQTTDDGGFLVTGYTDATALTNGKRDVWLVKFDSLGNKLWEKTFGGTEDDSGFKILKLSDGNLLIPGYSESFSSGGDRDGWIVKTDSSGNFIWSKSFGGLEYDDFAAAAEDEDGNLYLTGTTESSGDRNLWILKIDQQADTLWTKLIRSTNGSEGYSVIQTPDNGYAMTGVASSSGTGSDVWVIRLKPEGTSGIEDEIFELPKTFALNQNYPNPFNPITKISWQSPVIKH